MSPPADGPAPHWLLLHGTPLRPAVWTEVAGRLPGSVWAPDITPTPGLDHPQRRLAEHVVRQAGTAAGRRWRVVGHSFGGQVALELASIEPDLVEELIVVCSRDTPYPPFGAAADSLDAGNPIDVDAALHRWFRPAELAARPPFIDRIAAELTQADRRSWATALRGIAAFDGSSVSRRVVAPTTLIAAEYDPVGTPDAMRELAGRVPMATIRIVPDAAHMSLFLDPDGFAAALDPAAPGTGAPTASDRP